MIELQGMQNSQIANMGHWQEQAACRGHADIFYPKVADDAMWEEAVEAECKAICAQCSSRIACVKDILSDPRSGEFVGVFGGMNRWERKWLISNQTEAVQLSQKLAAAEVSPAELREWCAAKGPDFTVGSYDTVQTISERFGVSENCAKKWIKDRGGAQAKRYSRPWSRAIRELVAATPEQWFSQTELVEYAADMIPDFYAAATQRYMIRSRGTCSDNAARSRILQRSVAAAIKSGVFEKKIVDGSVMVRYNNQQTKSLPAHSSSKVQGTLFQAPSQAA